jgi:hypothetical protein
VESGELRGGGSEKDSGEELNSIEVHKYNFSQKHEKKIKDFEMNDDEIDSNTDENK